jgi:hypothetical protein
LTLPNPLPIQLPDSLTCFSCKYPLRGLSPDTHCPECGHSVAASLAQHVDHAAFFRKESFAPTYLLALSCVCAIREFTFFALYLGDLKQTYPVALGVALVCEIVVFFLLLPLTFNPGGLTPHHRNLMLPAKFSFFITYSSPAWIWPLACFAPYLALGVLALPRGIIWVTIIGRLRLFAQKTGTPQVTYLLVAARVTSVIAFMAIASLALHFFIQNRPYASSSDVMALLALITIIFFLCSLTAAAGALLLLQQKATPQNATTPVS